MTLRELAKWLLLGGATLMGLGALLWLAEGLGLRRVPGDIVIERPGITIWVPLGTSLLLSVGLSVLLWLLGRLR
ncbi:MAG TPA: DUF2905 family protein [Myxococcota bacterium]|nr:DUF2905 family protein [Myxococcota bacterium]